MRGLAASSLGKDTHTAGGAFPLYNSEDVRTDTVRVRIYARVQDDLAAAIIHIGTFYPGPGKVLHIEADDLHQAQESDESVDDVKENKNGKSRL